MTCSHIVVSGTAASGKTTLARRLAERLDMTVVDKDDYLEALYDQHDDFTPELRWRLSREADEHFRAAAESTPRSILVSFWARDLRSQRSGTPTEWLGELANTVELHCSCVPEVAAARFVARRRHRGHCDPTELTEDVLARFRETAKFGPIGLHPVVRIDTTVGQSVDIGAVAGQLRAELRNLTERAE